MRKAQLLKYQQGGKSKLHFDNPYLDAAVELTPLGDARDIYEGVQSGDYQQSVGGIIGLGGSLVGISVLPKLIKGYKAYKKLNKASKIVKTSPFRIVRDRLIMKEELLIIHYTECLTIKLLVPQWLKEQME